MGEYIEAIMLWLQSRWLDGEMTEVLNMQGWLRGYGSEYLTSQQGRCIVTVESYAWNGETFVPIARKTKTIRCQIQ